MKQQTIESEGEDLTMDNMRAVVQSLKVQWALEDVLHSAKNRSELTMGVHKAAEELAEDHSSVALCVLVDSPNTEPGVHVHCRLIEAFCWECFIPVIKVNSSQTLKELLGCQKEAMDALHCVLVKGSTQPSEALKTVLSFTRHVPAPMLNITR